MEDLQLIIYIVFGIIYLIFSVLKKRSKGPEESTPPLFEEEEERRSSAAPYPPDPASRPPSSLEELLERYDQAAQRAKDRASEKVESMQEQVDSEFKPVAANEPTIRNMEAEALEQMQRTERLKSLQEELPAKARTEVLRQERHVSKAIADKRKAISRQKAKHSERRFKSYNKKQQTPKSHQIKKMLSTSHGLKQAVILSEVLNPKHF